MNAERNNYRQRRNIRRGRMKFAAYVMGRFATAAMLMQSAAEKRAEATRVDEEGEFKRRPLAVHYDATKDETVTLSEYRREHHPPARSKYGPGQSDGFQTSPLYKGFKGYRDRKGATLKVHSGIVKPVGRISLFGGLFDAFGRRL